MTNHPRSDEQQDHGRLHDARDAVTRGIETAREAIGTSREAAVDAAKRTVANLDSPLGLLAGGLAVGVLAGALIPRSDREKALLAPLGVQLSGRARGALEAAREAGKNELEQRGFSRDAAREQAKSLLDGVVQAASTAGSAAAQSAKTGD